MAALEVSSFPLGKKKILCFNFVTRLFVLSTITLQDKESCKLCGIWRTRSLAFNSINTHN